MLTFEMVLKCFDLLIQKEICEVLLTRYGYVVMEWDAEEHEWYNVCLLYTSNAGSNPGCVFSIDPCCNSDWNRARCKYNFIHWRLPPFNRYSRLETAFSKNNLGESKRQRIIVISQG